MRAVPALLRSIDEIHRRASNIDFAVSYRAKWGHVAVSRDIIITNLLELYLINSDKYIRLW